MPSQPCCLLPTNQGTLTSYNEMIGVLQTNQGTLTSSHVMIGVLPTNQGTLTASHVMIGVLVTKKTLKSSKCLKFLELSLLNFSFLVLLFLEFINVTTHLFSGFAYSV